MKLQERSYNELADLVRRKDEMLNSIPSIQPVFNKGFNPDSLRIWLENAPDI
jgi:hypothetical protein